MDRVSPRFRPKQSNAVGGRSNKTNAIAKAQAADPGTCAKTAIAEPSTAGLAAGPGSSSGSCQKQKKSGRKQVKQLTSMRSELHIFYKTSSE